MEVKTPNVKRNREKITDTVPTGELKQNENDQQQLFTKNRATL